MKYAYIFLIFVSGVALGRWTAPENTVRAVTTAAVVEADVSEASLSEANVVPEIRPVETAKKNLPAEIPPAKENLLRTEPKARDKQVRELFGRLIRAGEKDDTEEQNRLFTEMERLEPKHEKVFEAKTVFLQDDEDWAGAHEVLKECIHTIPDSIYCHRRLANIRSSTTDDKLFYGLRCLKIAKNDPMCIVEVALASHAKGDFTKAKEHFEQALGLPPGSEGYNREYILFHYALTLENLHLYQKSTEALVTACRLNMKSACAKLKTKS